MKIALIYNSKSVDSTIIKHITIGLFPNFDDYTFIDTGKNVLFYEPTDNEISTFGEFIFIDTYPTLEFFNKQFGIKTIKVYSKNSYLGYNFDGFNTILYKPENAFSENANLHGSLSTKYLNINYSNITNGINGSNGFINQLYSNKHKLLDNFRNIANKFNKNIHYQKTLLNVGLQNDLDISNLLINEHIQSLVNMNNRILINNALNLPMKQYKFNDINNIDNSVNYMSIVTDKHKLVDSIIQLIHGDLFITNEIKFIEYTKFIDNENIQLTFVSVGEQIIMEPNYNRDFGSKETEQLIINYIYEMYNTNINNFDENIIDNYDNSITIKIPIQLYLEIKQLNQLNN